MKRLLPLVLLLLAGCGGGTSKWHHGWVSGNGSVTIDASGDNVGSDGSEKADPFDANSYGQGDPQYEALADEPDSE